MSTAIRDLLFLAGKALLACLVTLLLDDLLGNPDHVSSTFVAVLSVSAVALMGLRQGLTQLIGSALGGIWGTAATLAGISVLAAVPLAVGLAVLTAFAAGAASAYPIAAFTALYLILVPQGTPFETLGIRLLAVASGASGGFLVNVAVSALFYRQIYTRRLAAAETKIRALLPGAARGGPDSAENGFSLLAQLQSDLNQALAELRWRRARQTHTAIREMWLRVENLRLLLHLASNVGYIARQERIQENEMAPLLEWLGQPSAPPPAVPPALKEPVRHLQSTARTLETRVE